MRQRHIAFAAGVVIGAMVAFHGGVAIAQSACKKNCKSAFSDCKGTVKADDQSVRTFLSGLKQSCKELDKQERKTCLKQIYKSQKKLAKDSKKAALKRCKADKGCRVDFCEEQAAASGDDSCLVSSPMDSYGECIEAATTWSRPTASNGSKYCTDLPP